MLIENAWKNEYCRDQTILMDDMIMSTVFVFDIDQIEWHELAMPISNEFIIIVVGLAQFIEDRHKNGIKRKKS